MKEEHLEEGDRTSVGSRIVALAGTLFATIAALIAFDIAADYRAGTERPHILTESIVMALALGGCCSCGDSSGFCSVVPSS